MLKLRDLKDGERLLLDRRREGESQAEAAARHGVTRYRYRAWEEGLDDGPRLSLGRLLAHEGCFLMRRRAGLSIEELAAELQVSCWWVTQMERGNATPARLLAFWERRRPRGARRRCDGLAAPQSA